MGRGQRPQRSVGLGMLLAIVVAATGCGPSPTDVSVEPSFYTGSYCPSGMVCKLLTYEELQLIVGDINEHLDFSNPFCTAIYDDFLDAVSAGEWETFPSSQYNREGAYNTNTHKKAINSEFFYYDALGILRWKVPSWAGETVGQVAMHETLHEPAWGLQHTDIATATKQTCWDN